MKKILTRILTSEKFFKLHHLAEIETKAMRLKHAVELYTLHRKHRMAISKLSQTCQETADMALNTAELAQLCPNEVLANWVLDIAKNATELSLDLRKEQVKALAEEQTAALYYRTIFDDVKDTSE